MISDSFDFEARLSLTLFYLINDFISPPNSIKTSQWIVLIYWLMKILQFPIQVFIFEWNRYDPAYILAIIHNLVCFICMTSSSFGEKELHYSMHNRTTKKTSWLLCLSITNLPDLKRKPVARLFLVSDTDSEAVFVSENCNK
jgi:hypothetical protein